MGDVEVLIDCGSGFVPADITFEGLEFGIEIDSDFDNVKRPTLNVSEFTFCGSQAKKLIDLENSCNRCDTLPISIRCGAEIVRARISLIEGEFDEDNWEVTVPFELIDDYSCLYDQWEIDRNICSLDSGIDVQVYPDGTYLECTDCESGNSFDPVLFSQVTQDKFYFDVDCLDIPATWSPQETIINVIIPFPVGFFRVRTRWCRLRNDSGSATPPDNSGNWTDITGNGNWVQPLHDPNFPNPFSDFDSHVFNGGSTGEKYIWNYLLVGSSPPAIDPDLDGFNFLSDYFLNATGFNNGFTLENVLDFLVEGCGLELCSNFYGINPDGNYPMNDPYECALRDLQNLVVFQKTAIKFPTATGIETICFKDMKDLLVNLRDMHNIDIEIVGNKMRIEHESYFDEAKEVVLDLTSNKYKDCLVDTNKFSLKDFKIPQYQLWSWQDETRGRFSAFRIEYCECFEMGLEDPRSMDCFNPDIGGIHSNPESADDIGFSIVSTEIVNGSNLIINLNAPFHSENLIDCYWRHGAFHDCFIFQGEKICAESAKRSKIQTPITVPMCCEDFVNLDKNGLVRTQYGDGEIVDYTYKTSEECLVLTLAHQVINCCEEDCDCVNLSDEEIVIEANNILVTPNDPNGRIIRAVNGNLEAIEDFISVCIKDYQERNAMGGLTLVISNSGNTHVFSNVTSVSILSAGSQSLLELEYEGNESSCPDGIDHDGNQYNPDEIPATFNLGCYACLV